MIPADSGDMIQEDRLSNHNETILSLLRKGPVTNVEIAKISKNHTARISNIRKAGYDVRCKFLDRKSGLTEYRLIDTSTLEIVA